jgi:hypothetical protein
MRQEIVETTKKDLYALQYDLDEILVRQKKASNQFSDVLFEELYKALTAFANAIKDHYPERIKNKIANSSLIRDGIDPSFHQFKKIFEEDAWIRKEDVIVFYNSIKDRIEQIKTYLGYEETPKAEKERKQLIGDEIDKVFIRTHFYGKKSEETISKTKDVFIKDLFQYNLYAISVAFQKHTLEKGTFPVISDIKKDLDYANSRALYLYVNLMWVLNLYRGS